MATRRHSFGVQREATPQRRPQTARRSFGSSHEAAFLQTPRTGRLEGSASQSLNSTEVRQRRRTLPAPSGEGLVCDEAANSDGECAPPTREWVTRHIAAWRTAPSAVSFKIDDLPAGRRVSEVWSRHPFPGWVQIEPRGFLHVDDLAPVAPAQCRPGSLQGRPYPKVGDESGDRCPSPATRTATPRTARMTPRASPSTSAHVDGPRGRALSDEAAQLCEGNTALRERELEARRVLEALQLEREAVAKEVGWLREQEVQERNALERCRRRRTVLAEKLEKCSKVIARAVSSVDALYAAQNEATTPIGLASVRGEAAAAGEAVAELLADFRGGAGGTPTSQPDFDNCENSVAPYASKKDAQPHANSADRVPLAVVNAIR